MNTFTKIFSVCLLSAFFLTVNAQVDQNFITSADIASGWTFTAPGGTTIVSSVSTNYVSGTVAATVVNSDYLSLTRNGSGSYYFPSNSSNPALTVLSATYQPAGGINFGADRFIAIKSSSSNLGLNFLSSEAGSTVATCAHTIPVSPVPGTKFYIHLFRLSEFTGTTTNLNPTGALNCTSMEITVPTNSTPSMSVNAKTAYIDWIKTFSTEADMVQYALDHSKLDVDFKATDAINASNNFWVVDGSNNNLPDYLTNSEYMSITPKSGLSSYPVTTAVRYQPTVIVDPIGSATVNGFDWDLTNNKVVVAKMQVTAAATPQINFYAVSSILPGNISLSVTITPESDPQSVPNSSDKLYVFNFPSSITKYTGKQRIMALKMYVSQQNSGDIAKVDFVKVFPDLTSANAYVTSYITSTGVDAVNRTNVNFKAYKSAGNIAIEGMTESSLVEVFNVNGLKLFSKVMNNGSVPSLSAGVYIVKCKETVFKIVL